MFVCVWIFVLICIDRLEGTGAVQFSQHQATTFGANIEKLNCKNYTLYEWKKVPPCGECLHEWNIGAFTGNWRQCPPSFIKNEVYSYCYYLFVNFFFHKHPLLGEKCFQVGCETEVKSVFISLSQTCIHSRRLYIWQYKGCVYKNIQGCIKKCMTFLRFPRKKLIWKHIFSTN